MMDETKLRAILNNLYWSTSPKQKKSYFPRVTHRKTVVEKAVKAIQALLPPKIPVYKSEELAEAMDGGDLLKHQLGGPVLDIDLRGGDGKT